MKFFLRGGDKLRVRGGNRSMLVFRKAGEDSGLSPPTSPHGALKSIIQRGTQRLAPEKRRFKVGGFWRCAAGASGLPVRQQLLPPISWLNARMSGFLLPSNNNNNTNPTHENQRAQLKEQETDRGGGGGRDLGWQTSSR